MTTLSAGGKAFRVLVMEDDPAQRAILSLWLRTEGYQVTAFSNGLEARAYLAEQWTDLLVLDWDVPGLTGEQVLAFVRGRARSSVPVIFQTVHSAESDIAKILDAGADDFLVKPLDRTVFLARVRAVLRRAETGTRDGRKLLVGDLALDRGRQALVTPDAAHALGTKEFDILWHLAAHAGTVVQRQDLLAVVWGWDVPVQTRNVDMYVSRTRAQLKKLGVPWTIQSVYGAGYRLNLSAAADEDRGSDGEAGQVKVPSPPVST